MRCPSGRLLRVPCVPDRRICKRKVGCQSTSLMNTSTCETRLFYRGTRQECETAKILNVTNASCESKSRNEKNPAKHQKPVFHKTLGLSHGMGKLHLERVFLIFKE